LTYKTGRQRLLDLSEAQNRDILVAVIDDIIPKFKELVNPTTQEKLPEPTPVKEVTASPLEVPVEPAVP
jgi:hypothetical protein